MYILVTLKKKYNKSIRCWKIFYYYSGPYTIKSVVGYSVYYLVDDKGKSKGNWHVKDIKPCTHRITPD